MYIFYHACNEIAVCRFHNKRIFYSMFIFSKTILQLVARGLITPFGIGVMV
jgi:hypothetical protein